jgi:FKBP-type peptidyl-prolyl cis-trans isomerase
VIRGWTEGIPYFKEGKRYSFSSCSFVMAIVISGIPGGSVLIFEVKLIKVN